jgi:hypothetical protein
MAGSIGDVGTLITLALVASFFYNYSKNKNNFNDYFKIL